MTDIWVETVLNLAPINLRKMEMLALAQDRLFEQKASRRFQKEFGAPFAPLRASKPRGDLRGKMRQFKKRTFKSTSTPKSERAFRDQPGRGRLWIAAGLARGAGGEDRFAHDIRDRGVTRRPL